MFDLAVIENGNGGDIQVFGNDLAIVNGIENMPYLGMFGGNLEQSTVDNEVTEFSLDWWGNDLLMKYGELRIWSMRFELLGCLPKAFIK